MADEAHSEFSASGASGWSSCYGKPALEEGRKTTSSYADEGTAAHTLASWVMEARFEGRADVTAETYRGKKITVPSRNPKVKPRVFTVGDEMIENVDSYVDTFMAIANRKGAERFCEVRVHYHDYLGLPKAKAWGTSDAVAIVFDAPAIYDEETEELLFPAGDELVVDDLKYGKGVRVDAEGNPQPRLYALGALYEFGHLANITRVRILIHQPRLEHLSEEIISVKDLERWAREEMRPAVPRVLQAFEFARSMRDEGVSDMELGKLMHERGFLRPSEKACLFCDGAAVCGALIAQVSEGVSGKVATADDFDDLTVDTPKDVHEYGGNYLAHAYSILPLLEIFAKAVRAEIARRVLVKGERIEGVKVVAGKKGAREFIDEAEVEAFILTKVPQAIRQLLFKRKMLTPTQMGEALKHHPVYWAMLQKHITSPSGKPAVVPLSDRRKAISHTALKDDFDDLTAEDEPAPFGVGAGHEAHPFR